MTDSSAIANALRIAERRTERNPSDAQKESGNYAKGKMSWKGLPIAIENPKGSERSGMGRDGKRWSVKMPAPYGYFLGTEGKDGDHVDTYIGPDHASEKVFVVDQIDAENGRFDEHKCLLSYPNKDAALADYRKAFSDGKATQRIGSVTELSVDQFKDWLKSGNTKKPLGDLRKGYATGGRVGDMATNDDIVSAALRLVQHLASGGRVGYADGGAPGKYDWRSDMDLPGPLDNLGPRPEARNADRYSPVRPILERAGSAALDYGPLPAKMATEILMQPVRAGEAVGTAAFDPTLANVTDAGVQSALALFKPMHALKALGAGYGIAGAKDLGLSPFGEAKAADDGLTADQRKRLTTLQTKSGKQGLTKAEREEQNSYLGIQRDYLGAQAAAKARSEEKEKGLKAEAEAAEKSSKRAEWDRAISHAEKARAEELARVRRFSDTATGKIWDKTGGLAPAIAGVGLGGLTRAAGGGGSAVKDYVVPMASGALAGGLLSNLPLAYDSFSTEAENPERRAYEAYARELPPGHERKQEWQDYARGLPEANPVRTIASKELYDPLKAAERIIFGALEGAGGGLAGAEMWRLPGRALDIKSGLPARRDEAASIARAKANEAKSSALTSEGDVLKSEAALDRLRLRNAEVQRRSGAPAADLGSDATGAPQPQRLLPEPFGNQSASPSGLSPRALNVPDATPERQLIPQNLTVDASPELKQFFASIIGDRGAPGGNSMSRAIPAEPGAGPWAARWSDPARAAIKDRIEAGGNLKGGRGGLTQEGFAEEIGKRLPSGVEAPKRAEAGNRLRTLRGDIGDTPSLDDLMKYYDRVPSTRFAIPAAVGAGGLAASSAMPESANAAPLQSRNREILPEEHPRGHTIFRHKTTGQFAAKPEEPKRNPIKERKLGGGVRAALDTVRRYAHGGAVHVGPVVGHTGGREDALPISVPSGAFVVPADIVSSLGTGNTLAGMKKLEGMFGKSAPGKAHGGVAVPIRISDGEFVLSPDQVAKIGNGDVDQGHKILDALVVKLRQENIKTLKALPPPSK